MLGKFLRKLRQDDSRPDVDAAAADIDTTGWGPIIAVLPGRLQPGEQVLRLGNGTAPADGKACLAILTSDRFAVVVKAGGFQAVSHAEITDVAWDPAEGLAVTAAATVLEVRMPADQGEAMAVALRQRLPRG
ncbi:hypothetical protein BH20ACT5_BH20ACT5_10790 [soil metagenome]